ncbi:Detoxification-like protein [Thalictrum thalictroides]|uniref:Protein DETOXIFICATION n=1 Tax=Thalictrum thalictroides TaxID=46969 RepID=A0A7J6UW00_THATH|nr:Detoxification-like protein [Thalictrum thalictroides]
MRDLTEPLQLLNQEEQLREKDSLIERVWIELKKIWKVAGPAIFSRIAMFSMTLITQAFAGHLSNLDLAAISIATTVIITISFGFLLGMASALETLCGQAYGAKQYHMMGIYLQRSWIVLFACSILLLPMYLFATPILKLTGQSDEIAKKSGIVAIWLIPLHFSFAFQFPLQRFLQCQIKTFVIVWVSCVALVVHVIMSWFFVYKLNVGVIGTAIILDFSWWIAVLGLFVCTVCGWCSNSWTGFSIQAFSGLWEFFKLSAASGVMLCLESWYFRILIIVSGNVNTSEVALGALSICISIFTWESMIMLGFFAATGVRVANELGAGNGKAAKFATTVAATMSLIVGLLFWFVIIVFRNQVALIFTSSPLVLTAVNKLSVILAFTILLNSIQPVLSGVAVGSGWQAIVAYINIGCYYIIGVPVGILMGWVFHFGIEGLWVGMLSGTVVQTLILTFITLKFNWKKKYLVDSIPRLKKQGDIPCEAVIWHVDPLKVMVD